MTQTEQLANAYRAATLKDTWYGPSLAELIGRTTPELAVRSPVPNAHSVSVLLQHLLLWNERIRNTATTSPMPKWDSSQARST